MESNQKLQHGDYEYQIAAYKKATGMQQGVILVLTHAGIRLTKIIKIPIPTIFKTERAARIEASALACQLIETGAMIALMPQMTGP